MRVWVLALITAFCAVPCSSGRCLAEPGEYRFAPGDVVEISVFPQHSFDRTVTVQPDGKISYPIVGPMQAAGLTGPDLAAKLRAGLSRELADPQFTVSLKELNKGAVPRVSVFGAVRSAGVVEIREGTTIAEALAAAGGPAPQAELRSVTISRADGSTLTADLSQGEKAGASMRGVVLRPGDIIVVPQGPPPTVLLIGEVGKPGPIDVQGETRLLNAISQAGGPTAKADLRRVTLARLGVAELRTLDLQGLFAGRDLNNPEINLVLRPGDAVVIPETEQEAYVLGRVAKPDLYALKPNERVLDLLARAGGAAADGDLSRAVLVRRDAKGQAQPKLLDLKRIMVKGSMAENELLRPGDVLFVPDKKSPHSSLEFANILWPVTGLVNLLRR